MLIPLQAAASYSLHSADQQLYIGKYNASIRNIRLFKSAVSMSKDHIQLNRVLVAYQGVSLPADTQKPNDFAKIKSNILQNAKLAENLVSSEKHPEKLQASLALNLQIASRNILLSLAYSFGFAVLFKRGDEIYRLHEEGIVDSNWIPAQTESSVNLDTPSNEQ